jgi:hypothetical protein
MEIYLGRRAVRQIRDAAREAIEDGDNESLREEILDAFPEEDVQAIERLLDGEDLFDFITTMLDDWGGDDIDELFELLESQFAEIGVDITTELTAAAEDTEVLEEDDFVAGEEFAEADDTTATEGGDEEEEEDEDEDEDEPVEEEEL